MQEQKEINVSSVKLHFYIQSLQHLHSKKRVLRFIQYLCLIHCHIAKLVEFGNWLRFIFRSTRALPTIWGHSFLLIYLEKYAAPVSLLDIFYFESPYCIREVASSMRRSGTRERCHILMMEAGWLAVGGYRSMQFPPACPVPSERMLLPPAGSIQVTEARSDLGNGHTQKVTPYLNFLRLTACGNGGGHGRFSAEFENSLDSKQED